MKKVIKYPHSYKGFTLIEILIAMAIFSFIALGTGGAISRGLNVKKRTEKEWEEIHGIRTTLNLLQRDIGLAFHVPKKTKGSMFGSADESKWFKTYFIGKSNNLEFTSLAHRKYYSGTHESDLCEIGYRIETDEDDSSFSQLVRRIDPIVDEEQDKGGSEFKVVGGIKGIEFKFYSLKQDRWLDEWDTSRRDFEDTFPEAVHIKLILKKGDQELEYSTKVLISSPNNEVKKTESKGNESGSGTGPDGKPLKNPNENPDDDDDDGDDT